MVLLAKALGENNLDTSKVVSEPVGSLPTAANPPSLAAIETIKVPRKPTYMKRSEAEAMVQQAERAEHDAKCAVKGYAAAERQIQADTKVTEAHHKMLKVATVEALKRAKSAAEVAKVLTMSSVALAKLGHQFEADKKHSQDAITNARQYLLA